MKIAIIDADLIGRKKHRFPNLACMKISAYHKKLGDNVALETSYDTIENYDKVYISKVFTDTPIPENVINLPWIEYGGTGFYFDKAPDLPYEIEHSFPDYHLYDDFIERQKVIKISAMVNKSDDFTSEELETITRKVDTEFKEYTDCSIGYLTRGCFRKCDFCVNKKYDRVFEASPLSEFYDPSRPRIVLLDDNFFGFKDWKIRLDELRATGKPFKFKQGLDERLLTPEKCEALFNCKYYGEITFAFDDIRDFKIVAKKLKLIREYTSREIKFYVLCAFDKNDRYGELFWVNDIFNIFERIRLLGHYRALPYIMRFNKYNESPYKGIYTIIARWCNQPGFFRNMSLNEFIDLTIEKGEKAPAEYRRILFEKHPNIKPYFKKRYWGDRY